MRFLVAEDLEIGGVVGIINVQGNLISVIPLFFDESRPFEKQTNHCPSNYFSN